jgi:Skp family chaperone for outer membrane proteins
MKKTLSTILILLAVHQPCVSEEKDALKFAYINPTKVVGLSPNTKETIDNKVKLFAEKNSIDLILENAVTVNPDVDITEQINLSITTGTDSQYVQKQATNTKKIRISFINTDKLYSSLGYNSASEKTNSLPLLNQKINEFSAKNSIDLVLQKAVYTSKGLDCTEHLSQFITEGKHQPLANRNGYVLSTDSDFKFVNASVLFSKHPLAVEAEQRLREKFKSKEEFVRELQATNAPNFIEERQKFQSDLTSAKKTEFNAVLKQINSDLNSYRIRNSYQIILQEVVFASPQINVTEQFLSGGK